jgi:hypothetical protein
MTSLFASLKAKVFVVGVLAFGAFTGSAYAGALPNPVQNGVSSLAGNVGVSLPSGKESTLTPAPADTTTTTADTGQQDQADQNQQDQSQQGQGDQGQQGQGDQGQQDQGQQGQGDQGQQDQGQQG